MLESPSSVAGDGSSASAAASFSPRDIKVLFPGLVIVLVLGALDQNILNTALPRIASDFGGLAIMSWVITAFMITGMISTPLYGKLSDLYGRKPLILVSVVTFLLGSVLCGLSQSMLQLIVFRALQGLGAGGLITLTQTAVGDFATPLQRVRYQGYFTAAFAMSSVAGPIIGGVLTVQLSWRWVFYINIPLGLVALVLIVLGYRGQPTRTPHASQGVDYLGALLLAMGATCLTLALSLGGSVLDWTSPALFALLLVAAASWALFFWQEGRAVDPILGLHLFRNASFTIMAICASLLVMAMMGALIYLPLCLQLVLGMDPMQSALVLLPQVIAIMAAAVTGSKHVGRQGRYKHFLVLCFALQTVGLLCLAWCAYVASPLWAFIAASIILGLGIGSAMPTMITAAQNTVSQQEIGVATSTVSFANSVGGAFGVALGGGIMAAILAASPALSQAGGLEVASSMEAIAALPSAIRNEVIVAYQHAIGACMLLSGIATTGGLLLCAVRLPDLRLKS